MGIGIVGLGFTLVGQREPDRIAAEPPPSAVAKAPVAVATPIEPRAPSARPIDPPAPPPAPRDQEPASRAAPPPRARNVDRAPPAPPAEKPKHDFGTQEARVRRALSERGLTLNDLESASGIESALGAWKTARDRKDVGLAQAAADDLIPKIAALSIDVRLIQSKLNRLSSELEKLKGGDNAMPLDQLQVLQNRYFELCSRFAKERAPDQLSTLAVEIAAFERELHRGR
jgi:hypothetical protein